MTLFVLLAVAAASYGYTIHQEDSEQAAPFRQRLSKRSTQDTEKTSLDDSGKQLRDQRDHVHRPRALFKPRKQQNLAPVEFNQRKRFGLKNKQRRIKKDRHRLTENLASDGIKYNQPHPLEGSQLIEKRNGFPIHRVNKPVQNHYLDFYDPYPKYKFEYGVHDSQSGDFKSHKEERDGDVVRGSYELIEPSGAKRVVEYTSDKNGFTAVVRREHIVHPAQARPVTPGGHPHPAPSETSPGPEQQPAATEKPPPPGRDDNELEAHFVLPLENDQPLLHDYLQPPQTSGYYGHFEQQNGQFERSSESEYPNVHVLEGHLEQPLYYYDEQTPSDDEQTPSNDEVQGNYEQVVQHEYLDYSDQPEEYERTTYYNGDQAPQYQFTSNNVKNERTKESNHHEHSETVQQTPLEQGQTNDQSYQNYQDENLNNPSLNEHSQNPNLLTHQQLISSYSLPPTYNQPRVQPDSYLPIAFQENQNFHKAQKQAENQDENTNQYAASQDIFLNEKKVHRFGTDELASHEAKYLPQNKEEKQNRYFISPQTRKANYVQLNTRDQENHNEDLNIKLQKLKEKRIQKLKRSQYKKFDDGFNRYSKSQKKTPRKYHHQLKIFEEQIDKARNVKPQLALQNEFFNNPNSYIRETNNDEQ